jgi:hypothetical protein
VDVGPLTAMADPVRRGKISHPETLALRVPWGVDYRTSRRIDLFYNQPRVRAHRRETSAARPSLKGPTSDRPGDPGGVPQVEAFTL